MVVVEVVVVELVVVVVVVVISSGSSGSSVFGGSSSRSSSSSSTNTTISMSSISSKPTPETLSHCHFPSERGPGLCDAGKCHLERLSTLQIFLVFRSVGLCTG